MMKPYKELSREELLACKAELDIRYKEAQDKGLQLDMSRGKPEALQLDMGMGLLEVLQADSLMKSEDATDCRNYGGLEGIPEARRSVISFIRPISSMIPTRRSIRS